MNFNHILEKQKEFFSSHTTKDLDFRTEQLRKLKKIIEENEQPMLEAIFKDFGKSTYDAYTTEISFVKKDIDYYLKNLKKLSSPEKVSTNIVNQLGSSFIYREPLGNTLIIGAWNYPYQLTLSPVVAAIAAGNTCIIKPSELPENTMKVMATLINSNFDENFLYVVEGGVEETTVLLELRFDKIFFTGSPRVGKIVYEAAAKNLTPVTLELGGKSPCIVTDSAKIEVAARRIVWGKFLNAGQTCVAPDYIYVHEKVKTEFLEKIKHFLEKFNYQENSEHYLKIINEKNFDRLTDMINEDKIFFGGDSNKEKRYIQPTVLQNITWEDAVMKEEIFGPILPVLSYQNFKEVLEIINREEKPLSAYIFTENQKEVDDFLEKISFGGGCINDVVMHLSNDHLPFGGVGNSGIGSYHGAFGFDAFSHQKAILKRATFLEPNFKYPPYSEKKLNIIKKIM